MGGTLTGRQRSPCVSRGGPPKISRRASWVVPETDVGSTKQICSCGIYTTILIIKSFSQKWDIRTNPTRPIPFVWIVFRLFITRVKKSPDWENTVIRNRPANPLLGLRAIPTANPSHDHPNVNFQPSIPCRAFHWVALPRFPGGPAGLYLKPMLAVLNKCVHRRCGDLLLTLV